MENKYIIKENDLIDLLIAVNYINYILANEKNKIFESEEMFKFFKSKALYDLQYYIKVEE